MTKQQAEPVDIAISGGGVVGGLAALMLAQARPDLRIAVIDASPADSRDPRTLALAHTTLLTLAQAGIDTQALSSPQSQIQHIHVSERGGAGSATLHAARYQLPALGQVVSAHRLQQAIKDACGQQGSIQWHQQTRLMQLDYQPEHVLLGIQEERPNAEPATRSLKTKLLVAADGGRSMVREHLRIARSEHDYQQTALIANITLDNDHQGWAYERFTSQGPIALLPRGEREMALVWCVDSAESEHYRALNDEDFMKQAQQAFGFRAGRFVAVQERASYPLFFLMAERAVYHRTVLLGNACHTLHPIAGQGYNLGVRDVVDLVANLAQHWPEDREHGVSHRQLLAYEATRSKDYKRIGRLTDGLVRVFSNKLPPLVMARNLGLFTLRCQPVLAYPLARAAMGYRNLFGEA